jgi:peptidoglycan/xylan/chitin deacetylase (PgdA/CDA1 family)
MWRRAFLRLVSYLIANGFVSDLRLTTHRDNKPFTIYMTFDDGPFANPDFKTGPTDLVLQILKENDARANFFLHGMHITIGTGQCWYGTWPKDTSTGNHLWRQGGNTVADNPTIGLLTQ